MMLNTQQTSISIAIKLLIYIDKMAGQKEEFVFLFMNW